MEPERVKRKQKIKLVLTEVAMVVSVIVLVVLLMFMVMGYSLKTGGDEWSLEQSGLVQLASQPSGASIEIDGEDIFPRTETSRMLSAGKHSIKLYRDGYDSWMKDIMVKSGIFLRIKYPRLFKDNRTAEVAQKYENIEWLDFASNRNSVLYAKKDSRVWHWVSLRDDRLTETEINTEGMFTGAVASRYWVGNGEKLLMKVVDDDVAKWLVVDLKNPSRTVNITDTFGMNFSDVKPLNDSADKMWAVENGNLRSLNLSSKESSAVLISNIVDFTNDRGRLVYVAKDSTGQRMIGSYREGDKESVKVKTIGVGDEIVKVGTEEYLGEVYLNYLIGQKLYAYKASEFPIEGQAFEMEEVLTKDLSITPNTFKVSDNGQFIVMTNEEKIALMDAETEQVYEYALENGRYFWLDDYLIGVVADGKLVVRDFDGTNRRELTKMSGEYPAIISVNGKWLYYTMVDGGKVDLMREEL